LSGQKSDALTYSESRLGARDAADVENLAVGLPKDAVHG
jgi:hypothetical protein